MKQATYKSSCLVGILLGTIAGWAAIYESWSGLAVLVILFFFTVSRWVFGSETFAAIKKEKKRRGQYWFEPMDKLSDLRFFTPLWGRGLIFFVTFFAVVTVIIIPSEKFNRSPDTTRASGVTEGSGR
jgi:hypothetical protein